MRFSREGSSMKDTCTFLGSIALAAGLVACQGPSKQEPTAEPSSPQAGGQMLAGPEQELQLLTNRAIASFRQDGPSFRAGHLTHDARVTDDIVEITPYHVDPQTQQRITGGSLAL